MDTSPAREIDCMEEPSDQHGEGLDALGTAQLVRAPDCIGIRRS